MSRRSAKDGTAAYGQYQQKRRNLALERQRNARKDKVQELRSLATAATRVAETALEGQQPRAEAMHEVVQPQQRHSSTQLPAETQLYGMDGINPMTLSGSTQKQYFARQLMQPEWMSDIPPDLCNNWLVMPRPEGKRCLVITSGGWTTSRSRTGAILHRFFSKLPAGGPRSISGHSSYCVLDCIFQEHEQQQPLQHQGRCLAQQRTISGQQLGLQQGSTAADGDMTPAGGADPASLNPDPCSSSSSSADVGPPGTYYIQDVLAWNGYGVVDCGAEFRMFWLQSKLAEEVDGDWCLDGGGVCPGHQQRFKLLPYWKATPEGLAAAAGHAANATAAAISADGFSQPFWPFMQDGVYFRHIEGHYELGGRTTPLALLWKDESCSRYLLDTDAAGNVPEYQQLVLEYQGPDTADVATADDPPVVLGRLPMEFVYGMKTHLRAGRLLRFSIREGGMLFNPDGSPAGADLAYEGPANQRRGRADLISKIMFQWQARRQPLKLEALIAASAVSVTTGGGAESASGSQMQQLMDDVLMQ